MVTVIPGLHHWASLVAQRLKHLPAIWGTRVRSLGREDPLEKEMLIIIISMDVNGLSCDLLSCPGPQHGLKTVSQLPAQS